MTAAPHRGLYFYLSHAHSDDSAVYFVEKFFHDLCDAVRSQTAAQSDMDSGFADLRPGGDSAEAVSAALAHARVFVPLYCPSYGDWPEREREGVRQRLVAGAADPSRRRIQPLIWEPLPATAELSHLAEAYQLAADIPEYALLGLFTMCRLRRYHAHYQEIVRRLASQIVAAIDQPAPSAAELVPVTQTPAVAMVQRDFVVAVLALTESHLPVQRKTATCYGPWPMSWQPFRNSHNVPVAKYTADLAIRAFHLPTRVVDFVVQGSSLETSPGVILMDPWILANGDGSGLLNAALERVRPWVTLMIVLDSSDPHFPEGIALARQVAPHVSSQNYKLTKSPAEFHKEIRKVINRTRRRYLNQAPSPDESGDDR